MDFIFFIVASIGMVLVIEGLFYSIFPDKFKAMTEQMNKMEDHQLRIVGGTMVLIGLAIVTIFKMMI